jgi:urease accessory protein
MPDSALFVDSKTQADGWLGRLELGFEEVAGATRLLHRKHEGPLRVQRALFPEGPSVPHVLVLHPPGGVVGGDRLEISIDMGPRSRALITTPAAQKLYRSAGPEAQQLNCLKLGRDAELEWLPGETIAFDGAVVRTTTRVVLEHGSAFIGWEISCYGCPSSGVSFERGRLEQRCQIFRREEPLLIERTLVSGDAGVRAGSWALRGNPVLAALYAVPRVPSDIDALVRLLRERTHSSSKVTSAVTSLGELIVVRASGSQVEPVRELLVASWRALRPRLLGRDAVIPRIWAT